MGLSLGALRHGVGFMPDDCADRSIQPSSCRAKAARQGWPIRFFAGRMQVRFALVSFAIAATLSSMVRHTSRA